MNPITAALIFLGAAIMASTGAYIMAFAQRDKDMIGAVLIFAAGSVAFIAILVFLGLLKPTEPTNVEAPLLLSKHSK